jgi:hypothetical protein
MYTQDQEEAITYVHEPGIDWGGTYLKPGDAETIIQKFSRWSQMDFAQGLDQETQLRAMRRKVLLDYVQGKGYFKNALP